MSKKIHSGKLSENHLKEFLLTRTGKSRKEVSIGPGFGVDVSAVELPGEQVLVSASDPLSLLPRLGMQESAWLSVCLLANDIATSGFESMYGQFVLNLPDSLSLPDFQNYWEYIHGYCRELGVSITGGHTGFVPQTGGTMVGGGTFSSVGPKSQLMVSSMAQAGDVLLVTKSCGLSATALLAMSFPETVLNRAGREAFEEACEQFYNLGVWKDAKAALGKENQYRSELRAMHDVTEGGLLGAVWEFATAAGLGVHLEEESFPVGIAQNQVASVFGLDCKQIIGAGSLLIAVPPEAAKGVEQRLIKKGIPCTSIGVFTPAEQGLLLKNSAGERPLVYGESDPYWHAYFTAIKKGWK